MEKKTRNKSKKRIVPFLHYTVRDFYEYDQLSEMNETKEVVFQNLYEAVTHSIKTKKDTADIFMINSDEYVVLNKDKWKKSLENAIQFYSQEEIQDYESCKLFQELINKL
jgi:hypothetical protein